MNRIRATFRTSLHWALLVLTTNANAQIEGTLFTQPDERVYLDYLRDEFRRNNAEAGFNIDEVEIPEIPVDVVVEETTGPTEYIFGGVMTRRDGSHSVWLNGALLDEEQLPEGFSLVSGARPASLRLVRDGNTYLLKPGQTVNLTDGTVSESARPRSTEASAVAPALAPTELPEAQPDAATQESPVLTATAPESTDPTTSSTQILSAAAEDVASADRLSPLANAISELTPEQEDALARLLELRQEETGAGEEDEANDASE